MALARYTFLPWLRRGAAKALAAPAISSSRAEVEVSVALNDGAVTGAPISHVFKLMGPGDVIGLSPDVVVRTEPRAGVTDFEPNYLAFIEFYDEDFCSRHTPQRPDDAHRIVPWLTLLVLADDEFTRNLSPDQPLASIRITAPDPASFFPPQDQLWAWAHVQVAGDLGTGIAPDLAQLDSLLASAPDRGIARLISPRRLAPDTSYRAFLVPTFEVGRKAGLGLDIDDESESGLTLSWLGTPEFPVYFEWSFRTGVGGDFEDLVQRIQPRPVDPRVGIRNMDISAPGFGMPVVAEPPPETPGDAMRIVGMEGALKSPTMTSKPAGPVGEVSTFPANVAAIVNAPAVARAQGDSDPVVAPPLMGGWHALVDQVDPASMDGWVNALNLDPRDRAAGGLGARVVRANQERYKKLAWEQVGEVVAANRRAALLRFAQAAAQKSFTRHVSPLPEERALLIAAPMFARVRGSPKTIRGLLRESRMPDASTSAAFRKLARPRGPITRRALGALDRRNAAGTLAFAANDGRASAAPAPPSVGGPTVEQLADLADARQAGSKRFLRLAWYLLAILIVGALLAYGAIGSTAGIAIAGSLAAAAVGVFVVAQRARSALRSAAATRFSQLTPAKIEASPPDGFALSSPGTAASAAPTADAIAAADYSEALRDFAVLVTARPPSPPARPALAIRNAHAKTMEALRPSVSYPRRAASMIRIGDKAITDYVVDAYPDPPFTDPGPHISPVLAYPDIKDPMYRPLASISEDLLVPNLSLVPANTISLMLTNSAFIEAYLASVNHEFAAELLWSEYPTDCRGSPFRQFWDVSAVPTPNVDPVERARRLKDIKPLHKWATSAKLGENPNSGRGANGEHVVLVLRGDLLKRYPNTMIYAQRARWSADPAHRDELALHDELGEVALAGIDDPNFAYPLFTASLAPDLVFVGFKLGLEEARGHLDLEESAASRASLAPDKLGWFFVLQEAVGETRMGLDEHSPPANMQSASIWDNLAWSNIDMGGRKTVDLAAPFTTEPAGAQPAGQLLNWAPAAGATSADVAAIFNQKPVLVAWHARQMLERGKIE
jgi:hypothetical protein